MQGTGIVFGAIIFIIVVFSAIGTFSEASKMPEDFEPGNKVAVLTGQSYIMEGKPCQENKTGFVSPTSPDQQLYWFKPERWLWPTQTDVSVIFTDGSVEWIGERAIVKLPADASLLLCPEH